MAKRRSYWLLKSEPDVFSYSDLVRAKASTTHWDGVRNYQARNTLRDEMKVGDLVLYYHSNAKPPGVAGFAEVASEAYPDPTALDPKDPHFDPKSDPEDPRWVLVDIVGVEQAPNLVSLEALKANPKLTEMAVVQRGSRLSVQPVTPAEWKLVRKMAGL